jgi:hypothetical protein
LFQNRLEEQEVTMTVRLMIGAAFAGAAVATTLLSSGAMARGEEPLASINLPIEGSTVVAQDRGFFK